MPIATADVAEVVYYNEDATSPLTVAKPAAFTPGQLLVLTIVQDAPSALGDLTGPPGWADEGNYNDVSGNSSGRVWSHVYDAADPSTWDFGYNAGADIAAVLYRIIDPDTTPVIIVTSSVTYGGTGSFDAPSVTPTLANDLLIRILGLRNNGSPMTLSSPVGMTPRGQDQVAGLYMGIASASKQLGDASATGVGTWTSILPAANSGGAFSIAIKSSGAFDPDPPPNPPPPLVPPWMMRQLISGRSTPVLGGQRTPIIKEKLSNGASNANFTFTTSTKTDVDDVLVLFHGNNFYTAAGLVAPTGTAGTWNLETTADNGTNNAHMKIWTRKVTVGGAQTITCARAIDEEHTAHLFVISGADPAGFVDGTATANVGASSTTQTAPSATPTTPNGLMLVATQSASLGDFTIPNVFGMTIQAEVDVGGICTSASAAEVRGNNSATGTRTFTTTAAGNFAACTIILKAPQDVVAPTSVNVNAECATFTLAGQDAVSTVAASSEAATFTLSGQDATVTTVTGTSAIAEAATFTIPAQDATLTIQPNAEAPSVSIAGQDATLSVLASAIESTFTMTGQDATPSVGVTTPEGPVVFVAQDPRVSLGVSTEVASFTTAAQDAVNSIAPVVEAASFTLSALDATISTSSAVNCAAQTATIAFAANDAANTIAPASEVSTLTLAALDSPASIGVPANVATLTMTSQDASSNILAMAQSADVSLGALNLSALVAFVSDYAAFSIAVQVVAVTTATYGWPLIVGAPSTVAIVRIGTPTNVNIVSVGTPTTVKIVSIGTPY